VVGIVLISGYVLMFPVIPLVVVQVILVGLLSLISGYVLMTIFRS
jgi:hypothetical protein